MCSADIFLGLLALLFPPLPVWVKCGICSAESLINILLCVLGYVPGLLHAWYIIAKYPEPAYEYESLPQHNEGGGRVTYVFVRDGNTTSPPPPHGPMSYGTTGSGTNNKTVGGGSAAANSNNNNNNQPQPSGQQDGGEGSSAGHQPTPPSYAEVVAGDNKIQSHD